MSAFKITQLARQFSTSAARQGRIVQAPIQVYGIEGRYAHALYSAASKEKKLDVVEKELSDFGALLQKDSKLADFFRNPGAHKSDKLAALQSVVKKFKYSDLTNNLVAAMAENNRFNKLDSVISSFAKIMSAAKGEVLCVVTTAKPLDNSQQKEVQTILNSFLKKGETLLLEMKVDPSIMGGMTVTVGDKFVDMSFSTKYNTYSNLLKQAV
ncbi:hypothetical protein LOTGIDRAFT_183079 [Lottia gigantea]|uniref:Oligomycin sensitivity conferral protein n=1 Tax=Lottia gigantea TaxID=225164 RepID=V4BKJ3_LOTGI|nr:hypothetical protein LOTGIDRAFT_183079 [Lottia gigantea]ESO89109.1 hypothetical protein LOTGIDRAFT_183079 [Lottia gigantea]